MFFRKIEIDVGYGLNQASRLRVPHVEGPLVVPWACFVFKPGYSCGVSERITLHFRKQRGEKTAM